MRRNDQELHLSSGPIERLRVPIIATSLLLLGLGVGGAWYVLKVQRASAQLARRAAGLRAADGLETGLREAHTKLTLCLLTEDQKYLHEAAALSQQALPWLDRSREL